MRTGPIALAFIGDRDAVARLSAEVAALTHPHPDSVDACVLWSLAIEQRDHQRSTRRGVRLVRGDPRRARPHRSDSTRAVDLAPRRVDRSRSRRLLPQQRMGRRCVPGRDRGHHVDRRTTTISCPVTTLPRRCGPQHGPAVTPTPSRPSPDRCSARDGVPLPSRWHGAGASTAGAPTTRRPSRAPSSKRWLASRRVADARTRKDGPASRSMPLWHQGRSPRRARWRVVRQLRRARRRGRRRRNRGRVAVPHGRRRRAGHRRAPHDRAHRQRPRRQPEPHPRPARHRADDRSARRLGRAGLRPLRPRRAPCADDGRRLPHHAWCRCRHRHPPRWRRTRWLTTAVHDRRRSSRWRRSRGRAHEPVRCRRPAVGARLDGFDPRRRVARVPLRQAHGLLALVERQPVARTSCCSSPAGS